MLELSKSQEALFALLRCSLGKETGCRFDSVNWEEVLKEAKMQAVPVLAAKAIPDDVMPHIKNEAQAIVLSATRTNMMSLYAINQVHAMMRGSAFSYMILKGGAAASYYPDPMSRMLGDVDFLIDASRRSEVEAVLEKNGYKRWDTAEHVCHVVFRKQNQDLEMHFEIAGIPHGPQGEAVRRYIKGAVLNPDEAMLSGNVICVPKPKYHGLVLLLHMQHHMLGEGLGLRHLMDLAVFVDRTAEDAFWQEDLLPLLREIGLYKYTQVMVKTGHLYCGTACPDWAMGADDALCDDVMQDILTGGNFGRKDAERSHAGMMISEHGKEGTRNSKAHNLYRTLHDSSAAYWPWIRKNKVAWFFADCMRAVKYVGRVAAGKRTSLVKMSAYADERRGVYERLEVFEVEK